MPSERWWPRESSSSGGTGESLHLVSILRNQGIYYLIGDTDKTQNSGKIKTTSDEDLHCNSSMYVLPIVWGRQDLVGTLRWGKAVTASFAFP